MGEPVCAGGNAGPCNDGSLGDMYGFSAEWRGYGLKLVVSHEMHRKSNRTGDAGQDTTGDGTKISQVGTADEYAWKFGAKYTYEPSGTTVAGIYEKMMRNDVLDYNERQRDGFYLSALQKLGAADDVM